MGFREGLAKWLEAWSPHERGLVLVGPSAGYCLNDGFLQRFSRIVAVDPDPMARHLFTWRYGSILKKAGCDLSWDQSDYFRNANGVLDLDLTKRLLERYPDSAILFCNFLGQIKVLNEDEVFSPAYEQWKNGLRAVLSSRSWASFHDRVSGSAKPSIESIVKAGKFLTNDEIISSFYAQQSSQGPVIELLDHMTGDLFLEHAHSYLCWQLAPNTFHLIEAVSSDR